MADSIQHDIYAPVIADLEARIAALQATLDNLRNVQGSGAFSGKIDGPSAVTHRPQSFKNDSFFGMTAGEAAKTYLSAMKKTQTVNAIGDALVAGGWMTSSKNIPENLRAILSRHPDFVRINGEFGLAEWYPGRKPAKRQGTVVNTAASAAPNEEEPDYESMREAAEEEASLQRD